MSSVASVVQVLLVHQFRGGACEQIVATRCYDFISLRFKDDVLLRRSDRMYCVNSTSVFHLVLNEDVEKSFLRHGESYQYILREFYIEIFYTNFILYHVTDRTTPFNVHLRCPKHLSHLLASELSLT